MLLHGGEYNCEFAAQCVFGEVDVFLDGVDFVLACADGDCWYAVFDEPVGVEAAV